MIYVNCLENLSHRSAIGEAHRGAYYTGSKAPTETDRKMRVRAARIDAELQRLAAMTLFWSIAVVIY